MLSNNFYIFDVWRVTRKSQVAVMIQISVPDVTLFRQLGGSQKKTKSLYSFCTSLRSRLDAKVCIIGVLEYWNIGMHQEKKDETKRAMEEVEIFF